MVAGSYEYIESQLGRLRRKGMELFGRCTGKERFNFKKITIKDMSCYFAAADIVLLSHESGLNSGILSMAATYSKPVVYPDIGNFIEQIQDWISESYRCGDVEDAIKALDTMAERITQKVEMDNTKWLANNSWDIHVNRILTAVTD